MCIMKICCPETKAMLIPYINEKNNGITVGGFQYGISRDLLVDNPEEYLSFFKGLDGTRNINELSENFDIPLEELKEILEELQLLGIIQENNPKDFDFCEKELQMYSRNINFFSWIDVSGKYYNYWETQYTLKKAKVLILGAGGTGSICASTLARMGVGSLTIVDFDKVELSNLNRQQFFYDDINQEKISALKKIITNINPFIKVSLKNLKIEKIDDLLSLGKDFDLVVSCIDKPKNINEILEEYTEITKIPRIIGGYASTMVTAGIFDSKNNNFTDLIFNDVASNYDSYMVNNNNYWKWDNAIIAPVAQIAGNLSSLYALYSLTGLIDLKYGKVLHLDLYNIQNEYAIYSMKVPMKEIN
jgi:molybdopterin/thiamine biosynthesis adenylyltransferase